MKFLACLTVLAATAFADETHEFKLTTTGARNASHNGLVVAGPTGGTTVSQPPVFAYKTGAHETMFFTDRDWLAVHPRSGGAWGVKLSDADDNHKGSVNFAGNIAGTKGFKRYSDGIVNSTATNFGGWIICGEAQDNKYPLFYINAEGGKGVPPGCDHVELKAHP